MNTKSSAPKQGDDTGYCAFVVGQHVVCVTAVPEFVIAKVLRCGGSANVPVPNRVYTVREVYVNPDAGRVMLRLKELVNTPLRSKSGLWEPGFPARKFRPLPKLKVEDFLSAPVDRERVSA